MVDTGYLAAPARARVEVFEAAEIPTAVVRRTDFPMDEMRTLFDAGFAALFPALAARGISPAGPAFSLHRRMPDETADLEIGVPVDAPLTQSIDTGNGMLVLPSVLPAGKIAAISHLGSYGDLGRAWNGFMEAVAAGGHEAGLPFWEVYVTEPHPGIDPATLRTDLYVPVA